MKRYFTLVVTRRQLTTAVLLGIVAVIALSGPVWWSAGARMLSGVEQGVTVAGVPVGGMLEGEVRQVVDELARAAAFLPRDAAYLSDSDTVVPAAAGRYVDVSATIRSIMTAPSGARLDLKTVSVTPTLTTRALQPIYRGPQGKRQMTLTVNVDWGNDVLPGMLKVFREKDVKVTFFLTGRWAKKFPADAKALADAGHEIGNHGLKHDHPKQLSEWDLTRLICDNGDILRSVTGQCAPLFAPPYGEVDQRIAAVAGKNGYRTIMWTIDTVDWKDPSPETIVGRVVGKAEPGAIVLMHPKPNTLKSLPAMIDRLQSQGYQLVTLSELLSAGE